MTINLKSCLGSAFALIVLTALYFLVPNQGNTDLKRISKDYPRVDGSTSTLPFSVLLACKVFGISYEWRMPPASERTVFPLQRDNPFKTKFIEDNIQHHGTHDAYLNLVKKKVDLIFVARAPSEREIQTAKQLGTGFDVKAIALDALVFFVNKKNPIKSMTLLQIKSIYGPESTKKWSELGGSDSTVEAFQREQDSGSQEIFQKLVMGTTPIRDPKEIPVVYTMAGPVNAVALHENGVAFSVYYYITNMAPNRNVKLLRVNNIAPSSHTIATSEYPLIAEVFAVTRVGTNKKSTASVLRDWLNTNEGRSAIQESGYVPIP